MAKTSKNSVFLFYSILFVYYMLQVDIKYVRYFFGGIITFDLIWAINLRFYGTFDVFIMTFLLITGSKSIAQKNKVNHWSQTFPTMYHTLG